MRRLSILYAIGGTGAVALAAATGADLQLNSFAWLAGTGLGTLAVAAGIVVHRPARRGFWVAIGAAELGWFCAALATIVGGPAVSASSYGLSSLIYAPGYAGVVCAAGLILRSVSAPRTATIDVAIGATVAAAVFWLVGTMADASKIGFVFAVWDLPLALVLLRVLFSGRAQTRAVRLLGCGSLLLVASDLAYFSGRFASSAVAAGVLSATYTAAYVILGAPALDSSMRETSVRRTSVPDDVETGRRTIVLMAVALLTFPVIVGVHQLADDNPTDAVIAGLGAAAVLLVVVRIASLLQRTNELRRRAEESEHLFRMVFESAGVGISVGSNGMMTRTNPALQRMFGYTGEELAGMHFTAVSHPDDIVDGPAVPHPGKTYTFEKRYVRKDGVVAWAEVTLTAPRDDAFGIAVIDDITDRKQLEQELRQAQKMEAIGQLAGGVAHDFNNLMTAVNGYAALLQRDVPEGAILREYVDAIAIAGDRAAELTRKLLAFSRRQVLQLEQVDVAQVVKGFDAILRRLLPENIDVRYEVRPGATARVDRSELEQVLLNLAVNARDAMPGGGALSIAVHVEGGAVELVVADTGVGMDEATQARIFDPFFTTKEIGQGTGLGLSTVDGIVAQFGGTIRVASAPGEGTRFTVRLPLDTDIVVAAPAAPVTTRAGSGTVLLVEDEEIVRRVTTELLKLAGYGVVAVANAEDALTLLAGGERPDVLVSDVVMTGLDGPALAGRARELVPELPVLFVSGYSAETLGDRTTETILTKPFTAGELAEHIELVRTMAPGGIEPPHAASKAAALSAELRGPAPVG